MEKFLRIFFGCHGRADRSFYYHGQKFPICARCTGELIGILMGIPITFFWGYPSFSIVLLLMFPMVCDGFFQLLTPYESKNIRRLITGILFGVAFLFFLIYFHRACVMVATVIVKLIIKDADRVDAVMERFLF